MTLPLVRVAMALMTEPTGRHWGYELFKRSGVRSGALYPMLTRLLDEGWLTDGWEDRAVIREKRPPRRYYELTDQGRRELGAIVQKASREARFEPIFTPAAATGECSATCESFARGWRRRWAISLAGRWA